jgi:hypothetical protein
MTKKTPAFPGKRALEIVREIQGQRAGLCGKCAKLCKQTYGVVSTCSAFEPTDRREDT